jgi:putative hemolysin
MDPLWLEIIGIMLLILLVGFFSAAEVAVLSFRKSRVKELADEGSRRAAAVLRFQNAPEEFLATVHLGGILSLILASGLAALVATQVLVPFFDRSASDWVRESSDGLALVITAVTLGGLVVVAGELVPKSLALRYSEPVALRVAAPLRVLATALRLPVWLLTTASNVVLALFRDRTSFTESRISEEEFRLMLEEGTRSGVIDSTEHELIQSIFEFTDTTAREVMIPRPDIVALNIALPRDRIVKTVLEEGYSRMPVYRETLDNILGVVYTKDLLGVLEHSELILLEDIIRPAYFVPETMKISRLMRELQERKMHMAVVIDEFGGVEGIVTMEDILEEIVGEIHDEYDEVLKDVESAQDGSFLVNARMPIAPFNERFGVALPENDEYETLSGFLNKLTGRIPELGEEIVHDRLVFAIVKKSQRRIRQVRVRRLPPEAPAPDA